MDGESVCGMEGEGVKERIVWTERVCVVWKERE
jgi:hypothetical protein